MKNQMYRILFENFQVSENNISVVEVFLLLSEAPQNEILKLMGVAPVWVVEGEVSTSILDKRLGDITIFNKQKNEKMESLFFRVFTSIEDHYGVFSQTPPFEVLHVQGLECGDEVRHFLVAHGFDSICSDLNGFSTTRV